MKNDILPSSFRDPSGFLFRRDGVLYRQLNEGCREDYELLFSSGLYGELAGAGLLVEHEETEPALAPLPGAFKVIRPEIVPFVSYPYEWCFGQLKDAALATLEIQKKALARGLVLKDASAYNIQFLCGRPVLIDTLSFACYQEGEPWVAYRQFCQHFLAPLALAARTDIRLLRLQREYIDGIPLDLASRLLPGSTRFKFGLLSHLHLHGRSQVRHAAGSVRPSPSRRVSKLALRGLVDSLESAVKGLIWNPAGTEWGGYYGDTNYSEEAMASKREIVGRFLDDSRPATVWDLGGNTGEFSRLAAERGAFTVCCDVDPAAVEKCYMVEKNNGSGNLLPLVMDLTSPSPALGWAGRERDSLAERGPCGLVMALALVHHLAISNNVSLPLIARYFAGLGRDLIVEFIPKEDSQVQRLLATREDVFPHYTREGFEQAFGERFAIRAREMVRDSLREIYLMSPAGEGA